MLVGIHTADANYTAIDAQLGGRLSVGRVFPDGMALDVTKTTPVQMVANIDKACAPVVAANMDPFFSFKFIGEPAIITSGKADKHLAAILGYVKARPQTTFYAAWHHEDEQTAITDSQFAAASSYVYSSLRGGKVANLLVGPIYQGYAYRSKAFPKARIPGGYDFLALDTYTSDWSGNSKDLSQLPDVKNFMAGTPNDAPIFFTERGVSSGSGLTPPSPVAQQGSVITKDFQYLRTLTSRTVMGYLYWNSGGATDGTSDYVLNSSGMQALGANADIENPEEPVLSTSEPTPSQMVVCATCYSFIDGANISKHYLALHPSS